ncbi:MAG: tyrosine-type recombinase/integrase [Bacillota bacterium]
MATVAVESLKRWKREQLEELQVLGLLRPVDDLVFTSQVNPPVHPRNLRDDGFRRICEAIGMAERRPRQSKAKDGSVTRVVPSLRFHDLRHSSVTFMLSQGVKPEVVQRIAGHSDVTTTLRVYRHVFEEEKKEAAQVVDAYLKTAQKRG